MEAIKISVEISVNLSESTQNFIKSLFSAPRCEDYKPAATPAPEASAAPVAPSVSKSIEDVRGMLAKKVNDHREAIKQKLNELGAPSVTKLDPAKYDKMYDFLAAL